MDAINSCEARLDATTSSATTIATAGPVVPSRNYDVFLNHRGPDVKQSFVSHLHAALEAVGALTFLDCKALRVGDRSWDAIESAIRHSKVHIAIFSPHYAESPWCLKELHAMLEYRTAGCSHLFLPVFFNVAPSDLRHLQSPNSKSCYSEAFAKLRQRHSSDEIDKWIHALNEASLVTGRPFDSQESEARLVKLIVSDVLQVLNLTPLSVAKHPVGVDEKQQEALDLMEFDKVQQGLRKLAIYGMGGVGKTTLAKSIYNRIHTNFDGFCFIESVRIEAESSRGLPRVQENILQALLKSKATINVSSTSHGKQLMINRFSGLKILIILDDIDDLVQLDALFSPFEACRLKDGSHLVITSRDEQIVISANVQQKLYMEGLSEAHANLLFNCHAFLCHEEPPEEFKALAKKVVKACGGLPLALEIFGAHLFGKDVVLWEETVKVFEGRHPMSAPAQRKVASILRISYDGLEIEEQRMFLDVACCMLGKSEDRAKRIWYAESDATTLWLDTLRLKSLVKLDRHRRLTMHDLLRDMGRDIVKQRSYGNIWQRSHLWDETDAQDALRRRKGASEVRAVRLALGDQGQWSTESFAGMDSLRFLLLRGGGNITGDFAMFPNQLRWLQWLGCPWKGLPRELDLSKVAVLDLLGSAISSLSNGHKFENLRELELGRCPLKELPDFRVCCKRLEELDVSDCHNLERVPESIGCLSSTLTHLYLRGCGKLATLPDALVRLHSLKSLKLDYCTSLTRLPDAIGQLTALEQIGLSCLSSLVILPQSLGSLTKLSTLDLCNSRGLQELPSTVGNLRELSYLCVSGSGIREIPAAVCSLTKLVDLIADRCNAMVRLPEEIGNLCNLERLNLGCTRLSHLPSSIRTLRHLVTLDISWCNIGEGGLPKELWGMSSLRHLDLSQIPPSRPPVHLHLDGHMLENLRRLRLQTCPLKELPDFRVCCKRLEELNLSDCHNLERVPESIGCLSSTLTHLHLSRCGKLTSLPDALVRLHSLKLLKLDHCTSLTRLPDAIGQLTALEQIGLSRLSSLVILPQSLGSLTKLSTLDLCDSKGLQELPSTVGNLRELSYLGVSSSGIREIPAAVCSLTKLVDLIADHCKAMVRLPEEIGNLCNLKRLNLSGCTRLSHLPSSIRTLRHVVTLDISWCNIGEGGLPKELGGMSSLRHLDLSQNPLSRLSVHLHLDGHMFENLRRLRLHRCPLKELPDFRVCCKRLEELDVSDCHNLERVPESIGCLSSTLMHLDLSRCGKLATLPDALVRLHSLKSLKLDGCTSLTRLPDAIGQLTALEQIGLSCLSSLVILPQSLGSLTKLSTLDLRDSKGLQELPSTVGNLRELSYLDVSSSGIREIPVAVCSLTNLVVLIADHCEAMVSLPEEIGNLCNLKRLNLMGCTRLSHLPSSIRTLRHVVTLDISWCNIGEGGLPKELWGMSSLRHLDLSQSPLSRLSVHLHLDGHMFENLRGLRLHRCPLKELPDFRVCCKRLEELDVSDCHNLERVPESIGCLSSTLMYLDLSRCGKLATLPDALVRLHSLKSLKLDGCTSLTRLPDAIGQLTALRYLDLSENPLSRLSEHLHLLTRLRTLNLAHLNELREIPQLPSSLETLLTSGCRNLREIRMFPPSLILWITGNCPRLMRLPSLYPRDGPAHLEVVEASGCRSLCNDAMEEFVGRLASLRHLYLDGTRVSFGPWIEKLVSLEELMLDGESLPECFIRYKQQVRGLGHDMAHGYMECHFEVTVPHTGEGVECKGFVLCAASPSYFELSGLEIPAPGGGFLSEWPSAFQPVRFTHDGSRLQVWIIRECLKGGTILSGRFRMFSETDVVPEAAVRLVHEDHEFEEITSELALAGGGGARV